MAISFSACNKYPGFSKDANTGIYYKFYGDVHSKAQQPSRLDFVMVNLAVRTTDKTILPATMRELPIDSVYKGDLFSAFRMMHEGDSATFVFDGKNFYEHFIGRNYPYGDKPIYVDVKMINCVTRAEKKTQVDAMLKQRESAEPLEIQNYLKSHHITAKPNADGIYYVQTRKGAGKSPVKNDKLQIRYTCKTLDGVMVDASASHGDTVSFTLGAGKVLPVWEKAMYMMREGEKATFVIPSKWAYGKKGRGNGRTYIIKPFTPLVMDIELVKVKK